MPCNIPGDPGFWSAQFALLSSTLLRFMALRPANLVSEPALDLLRPAVPALAAGPVASEVVLLLLPASLGGLPALLPDDPSDAPDKVRGL